MLQKYRVEAFGTFDVEFRSPKIYAISVCKRVLPLKPFETRTFFEINVAIMKE